MNDGFITGTANSTVTDQQTAPGSTYYQSYVSGGAGIGVQLAAPGSLVNAGTISGGSGTAVEFSGGYNLVVVDPGAVFQGVVDGGTGGDTLELAAGAGAGTLSGFGTQYLGFSNVTDRKSTRLN